MNIKRTIAAILAFLALASFAGCKGEKGVLRENFLKKMKKSKKKAPALL